MAVYDATDTGKKVYMSQKLYLDYGPKSFTSLMADFCQYLNRDINTMVHYPQMRIITNTILFLENYSIKVTAKYKSSV